MPRVPTATRQKILDAAYELFYRGGYARAGVDAIAEMAGVTKRTLYYHFESKDALLAAVLDAQHTLALARIARWGARVARDPHAKVDALFSEFAAWSGKPSWRGSGFTRAAIELADSPRHPARAAARRHKAAVEAWLAGELHGCGVREAAELARQLMLLIEGSNALGLIHGDPAYAKAAGEAARHLLERYHPQDPSRPRGSKPARRR